MDVINTSKVALTRNDLCGNRPRRAATAGTRSAMLLLAAVAALTGARAVRADEAVVAWGNNQYGQCTTPPGIGVVDAIAAGVGFTVALKADGAVVAWGYNGEGQCNIPAGIGPGTAIAAGFGHTVARANTLSNCEEQLAAAQAANAQQAAEILLLNARIAILQLGDLNEDGAVDGGDLATLLNNWGIGGK